MHSLTARLALSVYSACLFVLTPVLFFWLWLQSHKNQAYRQRWDERRARHDMSQLKRHSILVHCASVGEFLAAQPLIEKLVGDGSEVLVTCTTPTGSALIQERLGAKVSHCYLPIDRPTAIKRFLVAMSPRAIILIETEIWPNLIHAAKAQSIPTMLINGRMSERSLRGYQRVWWLFTPIWQSLDYCAAQTEEQAERFAELGVRQEALDVSGNLKFDVQIPPPVRREVEAFKSLFSNRQVITVGSTHEGEEAIVLDAFKQMLQAKPNALLILVPRHQERFEAVAQEVEQRGLSMVRRTSGRPVTSDIQVLLADTMGELLIWYGVATIAFVGGSLIERGGHNPLEPMAFGVPIVSGRHTFNFAEVYRQLDNRQAVRWVQDVSSLHDTWLGLLTTTDTAQRIGAQAQQVFSLHRGATARVCARIHQLVGKEGAA
ncbi:MAG: lipid IV(A) 3-deoxy-D-manno-octulosonic acid transferase [Idiomarina sp.]|nr:lipid IV(A) 3-deoxy-D-manno-octulosonic acid transferase [Idiomarina sp.]